jgi:hypothetical protein
MTTLQIESPDTTALATQATGLLNPHALDRLLTQALCRREAADLRLAVADRVAAAGCFSYEETIAGAEDSRQRRALKV